jgi:hypothetical protein
MNAGALTLAAPWMALVLIAAAAVAAMSALGARSLVGMCLAVAAMAALSAAALATRGGDGALALAAFGVGFAPMLLMAGLLLSTRAVKSRRSETWLGLVAACAAAGLIAVAAPELEQAPAPVAEGGAVGLWLAALVFVSAVACAGLLGYGERGVLGRRAPELEP